MEGDGRRRRKRHRQPTTAGATTTSIDDFPDDLLELVLLRIPSPITIARAAATCRPWRRLISGADFLRRHGCLHTPPVLGHFYASRATSFVPLPNHWGRQRPRLMSSAATSPSASSPAATASYHISRCRQGT
ncbi:unnamed protein product [Urochloa humidicola]